MVDTERGVARVRAVQQLQTMLREALPPSEEKVERLNIETIQTDSDGKIKVTSET
jgi:hypothetical protein